MARSAEELKQLSIKEFTEAAKVYESGHAGIYEMCKDDYPQMLEELELEPFEDALDVGCGTAPRPVPQQALDWTRPHTRDDRRRPGKAAR